MTAILLASYLGYISVLNRCHEFDCKVVRRFKNHACVISWENGVAETFGIPFEMRQFQWGNREGYHGQNGGNTLTVFFERGRIKTAYISSYTTKSDYSRWDCKF